MVIHLIFFLVRYLRKIMEGIFIILELFICKILYYLVEITVILPLCSFSFRFSRGGYHIT